LPGARRRLRRLDRLDDAEVGADGGVKAEVSAPGNGTLTLTDWQLRLAASPL
jgi:hypothetical protein